MTYNGNARLGDLFRSRREKGRVGLPLLSVTMSDGLVDRDDLERKQETSLAPEDHLLVKPGDIAYNTMRMWQGAFGLADRECLVSPAYVVLSPSNAMDSRYAAYLFKSSRLLYMFRAYSYGLTDDRLRLYPRDFARIPTTVPPKGRQSKIAAGLQNWERAIATTRSLIHATGALKKFLARQLLSGETRLPGTSSRWSRYSMKDFGSVVSGGTPDTENRRYWGGSIPWATPTDISNVDGRYITATERCITADGLAASSAQALPVGAVIVCTRATICELAIAGVQLATNQGFKSVIPSDDFDSEFLYYLFQFKKQEFIRKSCGSTFLELSKRDFERLVFNMPLIDEQRRIATVLNSIDDQVTGLKRQESRLSLELKLLINTLSQ